MSVLARKRKPSPMEFYANARKMRKAIVFLLLRDLGIKDKVRNLKMMTKDMEEADAKHFQEIAQKYGMASFVSEYPEWIIDKLRDSVWDILRDMNINITRAYTIWATNLSEAYERRNCMNRAIADCESLLQELQLAIDVLPIDAEKYMRYVDAINREIALLKGWRKSDNKRIRELQEKSGELPKMQETESDATGAS